MQKKWHGAMQAAGHASGQKLARVVVQADECLRAGVLDSAIPPRQGRKLCRQPPKCFPHRPKRITSARLLFSGNASGQSRREYFQRRWEREKFSPGSGNRRGRASKPILPG